MKLLPRNTGAKSAWLAALAVLLVTAPCTWAAQMRILHLDAASSLETPQSAVRGSTPGTRLRLSAGARQFDFLLEPNSQLLPNGQSAGIEVFKGRLPGLQGSWARLTRRNGHYQGIYSDGATIYLVDQAGGLRPHSVQAAALQQDATVIYKLSDTELTGVVFDGDTIDMRRTGNDALNAMIDDMQPGIAAAQAAGLRRLEVAVVADAQLAALDGINTLPNIIARMNIVDGIFSSQAGVQIHLAGTTITDTATQPFTSTVPSTLLDQVKSYRSGSSVQQSAGLTHLMTGRDMDGQTVGIAYIGSVCNRSYGSSLSEARVSVTFDALVAAHEVGHTFGAPHDGETGGACASTSASDYLMAARISGSSTLSNCSLDQMVSTITTATCLTAVDLPDIAISAPATARIVLNQPTSVTVTVRSIGTATVTGASLTVTPAAGVNVVSGTLSGGSCALSGGKLNCTLGDLPANDSRDVQLVFNGTASGNTSAVLQLAAANDGLATNNKVTLALTSAPGADLSVKATADASSVTVGQSTIVRLALSNLGLGSVTDGKLTGTLPAGIVVQSVSGGGVSCTVVGTALTCSGISLTVNGQTSVNLGISVQQAGAQVFSFNLQSTALIDPQTSNNDSSLTVTGTQVVTPPSTTPATTPASGNSTSGGGGSLDVTLLLGLLLLTGLRLRGRAGLAAR